MLARPSARPPGFQGCAASAPASVEGHRWCNAAARSDRLAGCLRSRVGDAAPDTEGDGQGVEDSHWLTRLGGRWLEPPISHRLESGQLEQRVRGLEHAGVWPNAPIRLDDTLKGDLARDTRSPHATRV